MDLALNYKKSTIILTDVMDHCQMMGASHFTMELDITPEQCNIVVNCQIATISSDDMEQMVRELSISRQHEMEEYYWNISGGESGDGGLSIVGMMVDKATVTYENQLLTIRLERKN